MILYLNNFRGFRDTFIPLETVNFFVGENSTGKSTVLLVLEMMSKTSFWSSPQLSSGEYNIGPFIENVNQLSADKTFFEIGAEFKLFNSIKLGAAESTLFRIVYSFKERDGNIYLDAFKYQDGGITYYCTQLGNPALFVAKREKTFNSFEEWAHSTPPKTGKEVNNIYYNFNNFSLSYLWIPTLMKTVQDSFPNNNGNHYPFIFVSELSNFTFFSPMRAEAHRVYESFSQTFSPQGEHVPAVLNKLMHSNGFGNKELINRLYVFGKNSSLFDLITTPRFGNSSTSPFSIIVEYDKVKVNLTNVGYGVNQSLPIVVEILKSSSCAFSIQQPEVHLHPKAQAAFGNLLYESALGSKNTFFCETHSDFIINRFRYSINKGDKKVKSQVLFFTRDNEGTHVVSIPIDDQGHYQNVPEEYMRFFIDEELRMLEF